MFSEASVSHSVPSAVADLRVYPHRASATAADASQWCDLGPILERHNAFQWTLPLPLGVGIALGGARDAPPGPNSLNFMQCFGKIWQNRMLAPPGGLAPPPRGNRRSATEVGGVCVGRGAVPTLRRKSEYPLYM